MDASDGLNRPGLKARATLKAKRKKVRKTDTETRLEAYDNEGVFSPSRNGGISANIESFLPPPGTLSKGDLHASDVILGCGGQEEGIYNNTLQACWKRYEAATHAQKRDVCREAIAVMHAQGVRFVSRFKNGSNDSYYVIESETSMKIVKKVLRALRQEVLKHTNHLTPEAKIKREQFLEEARRENNAKDGKIVPTNAKSITKGDTAPAQRSVAKKSQLNLNRPTKVMSNFKAKMTLQGFEPSMFATPQKTEVVLPPPPPPPPMLTISSFASLEDFQETMLPLIPSAVNWGTSDIMGNSFEQSFKSIASVSPNTVLPPQLVRQSSSILNFASFISGNEDTAGTKVLSPKLTLRSSVSFDLSRIFDDDDMAYHAASEDLMNKALPSLLGANSSIFSFDHTSDWFTNAFGSVVNSNEVDFLKPCTIQRRLNLEGDEPTSLPFLPHPYVQLDLFDEHVDPAAPSRSAHAATATSECAVFPARQLDRTCGATLSLDNRKPSAAFSSPETTPRRVSYVNFLSPKNGGRTSTQPVTNTKTPSRTPGTPERTSSKRKISDVFDDDDQDNLIDEDYLALRRQLDVSMAELEKEEKKQKAWEERCEVLWGSLINLESDFATMTPDRSEPNTEWKPSAPLAKRNRASSKRAAAANAELSLKQQLSQYEGETWAV